MNQFNCHYENGMLTVPLRGSIDSFNAPSLETAIQDAVRDLRPEEITLDCEDLQYITSAGLRVILRLKKDVDGTCLINVHSQVYEVLQLTGFTEMLKVEKAYRVISLEGCEMIGCGANGNVFRIDPETIVKVYKNADALPEIQRERELARAAFIAGIPTAISYDVVRIEGGGYGSVFELLNASSFAKLLSGGQMMVDEVAGMSTDLLKLIHSRIIPSAALPDMKAVVLDWARFIRGELPPELADKLIALIEAVPDDPHLIHGDYHLKNMMLQDGEALLIDMDTLCHGHPLFELAGIYNAYQGFGCADHDEPLNFLGISWETAGALWRKSLSLYFGTENEAALNRLQEKIMIVSYTRVLHHYMRHGGQEDPDSRAAIAYGKAVLTDLLPRTETLLF